MIFYLCHRRKILYSFLQFDFNVIFGEHSVVKSKLPSTRKTRTKFLRKTTWICLKVFGYCFEGREGVFAWQQCKEDPKFKQLKQLIFGKRQKFLKSGEDKCKSLLSVSCLGSSGGSNLVQKTVFPSTTSSCPTLSDILATFFVPFYSQSLWSNNSLPLLVNQRCNQRCNLIVLF